ncbi:MAG: thiamine-phosphate kinase [Acidobacteria bacterium]|nr:MAG: thiamine-phosphate kinase [Acidobacteriota bacterium]
MLPERTWLQWVRRQALAFAPTRRSELRLGIGDDAALVRPRRGRELVLTTDLLVEDVHFLRARDPAPACGRRLATRALSDLAAMGAEPLALLVSAALPPDLPTAWARGFYRGFLAACREAGATLIGGDSSASLHGIVLDAVGVGQVPAGKAFRRTGARPGDRIFVSGPLGEAAWGRELVHDQQPMASAAARHARARHLRPRARWELGAALRGRASAAMDLSDGLAVDLDHLCRESGVGAEILADSLPAPAGLQRALYGGEDYELLFTLPPHRRLPRASGHREIGRIIAGSGCWLRDTSGRRRRLSPRGWQHWA